MRKFNFLEAWHWRLRGLGFIAYAEGVQLASGKVFLAFYDNDGAGTPENILSKNDTGDRTYAIRSAVFAEDIFFEAPSANLVQNPYFNNWYGPALRVSGTTNREVAKHWTVVPSRGSVLVSRQYESELPFRNRHYMRLEVTGKNDYIGFRQTLAMTYGDLKGTVLTVRFFARSAAQSRIYMTLGQDLGRVLKLTGGWTAYEFSFNVPPNGLALADTDQLALTIGFLDSMLSFETLDIDNVQVLRK